MQFSFSPHSVLLKWLMNQKTAGEGNPYVHILRFKWLKRAYESPVRQIHESY